VLPRPRSGGSDAALGIGQGVDVRADSPVLRSLVALLRALLNSKLMIRSPQPEIVLSITSSQQSRHNDAHHSHH